MLHWLQQLEGRESFALLNACLNGVSTVLLVCAYVLVRRGSYRAHGTLMAGAFLVSCCFLASYVYSKLEYGEQTTASLGLQNGPLKALYLAVLVPHVLLSVLMLPFIFLAMFRASRRQWRLHTRWSRPAFWMWLYVSVTGVVVYVLLYHVIPASV
jgi:uncharacterized membrane protein YozB (DUF420 family)